MIVYRLCDKSECNDILNGIPFHQLGNFFEINPKRNNHQYVPYKRYLHFFENKDSLLYLNLKKGNFICTYDIPDDLVSIGRGTGKYLDPIFFRTIVSVIEIALPSEHIIFDYLKRVDEIISDIDVDDYTNDTSLASHIKNIYDVSKEKNKTIF